MGAFTICFVCFAIGYAAAMLMCMVIFKPYDCEGEIIMHENELYLAITEKDKEALETKKYATLRLVREKFNGFSE